jgi:Domain of unknown function (DUF397)
MRGGADMDRPMTEVWRKSTYSSGQGGECVELSSTGAVRDSKNPAAVLRGVDIVAFVASVKADYAYGE